MIRAHNTQSNVLAKYWRDASGHRAVKDVDGAKTVFFNLGTTQMEAYDVLSDMGTSTIHQPGIDSPLAEVSSSGTLTFYHQDWLGNVVMLTNAGGAKVQTYTYDVWGKPSGFDSAGAAITPSSFASRLLFTGREYDPETALYHYRARAYSPTLGRFLQTDPIDFDAGDMNLFRYVSNSPLILTDPEGLAEEHTKNARPSTKDKHEKNQARQKAATERKAANPSKTKAGNPPFKLRNQPGYLKGPGGLGVLILLIEFQIDDILGPEIDPFCPPVI